MADAEVVPITGAKKATAKAAPKAKAKAAPKAKALPKPKAEKKAAAPKAEKKPNAPCRCGCGAIPTKQGSSFLPGHDARLRGRLLTLQRAEAAKGDANSKKPQADRDAAYKAALAAVKGVDLKAAFEWLETSHSR